MTKTVLPLHRLRAICLAGAALALSGCVVLPADTVIYDDDEVVERSAGTAPDVVIIERAPVYVPPPPLFWYDSHWGYRHRFHHRFRHGYRDGRRPRGRRGARWEGRQGRRGVERGARQRGGEFRGRIRSNARSAGARPPVLTK